MEIQEEIQNVYKISKNYPELVKALIELGIECYTVDVATSTILYRFSNRENFIHHGNIDPRQIEPEFNLQKTMQAVKDTQQGRLTYPEFMDTIAGSGVRFYESTLNGDKKRVTYIGGSGYYEELIPV